jgi:hypothetical protein
VTILKLHGSIDWFSGQRFDESAAYRRTLGLEPHYHPIFSNAEALGVEPVVSGPRLPNDPMRHYSRVRNFSHVYNLDNLFHATPAILPPSKSKYAYLPSHNEFLRGVRNLGSLNFGLSVIGFSLPQQDQYARQILWNVFDNYQRGRWGRRVFGKRKSKAVLVDYFASEAQRRAYRRRYRFVNWRRAKLLGSGFEVQTLDSVFSIQ